MKGTEVMGPWSVSVGQLQCRVPAELGPVAAARLQAALLHRAELRELRLDYDFPVSPCGRPRVFSRARRRAATTSSSGAGAAAEESRGARGASSSSSRISIYKNSAHGCGGRSGDAEAGPGGWDGKSAAFTTARSASALRRRWQKNYDWTRRRGCCGEARLRPPGRSPRSVPGDLC